MHDPGDGTDRRSPAVGTASSVLCGRIRDEPDRSAIHRYAGGLFDDRAGGGGTSSEGGIERKGGKDSVSITTDFPDPDAALMLSQMKIETPFDESPFLEFAPGMRTGNGNWPIISLDPDVAGQREKRPADRPDHGQLCFNHRRLRELEHDTQGAGVSSLIVSNHSSLHNFRFGHLLVPWSVTQDKRCRAIADIAHECPQVSMWWSDEMGNSPVSEMDTARRARRRMP